MTTTRLRPVPSGGAPPQRPSTRRPRDVAQLSPQARATRAAMARWALQAGRCCDFDALTVVMACADQRHGPTTFTSEDVWRMWWIELADWCADRGVAVPTRLASTMQLAFDHLAATHGFGAGSDPIEELLESMEGAGALWRNERTPLGAG